MESALRKIGNSTGVTLPKPLLREAGLKIGMKVDLVAEDGGIMMRPVDQHPRAGWAEAAVLIGAEPLTGDEQEWLDLPNETDKDWTW